MCKGKVLCTEKQHRRLWGAVHLQSTLSGKDLISKESNVSQKLWPSSVDKIQQFTWLYHSTLANRLEQVVIPFFLALVRPPFKSYSHFWAPSTRLADKLNEVWWRVRNIFKRTENTVYEEPETCKGMVYEKLCGFILEIRTFRGHLTVVFQLPNGYLQIDNPLTVHSKGWKAQVAQVATKKLKMLLTDSGETVKQRPTKVGKSPFLEVWLSQLDTTKSKLQ